jgi:RNA polymerase sigma-70 factor, ECF subfamily
VTEFTLKNNRSAHDDREFVELFTKHQKRIFFYILSQVTNRSDADDLLQQTAGDMWEMFGRYQKDTNFLSWAVTIAKFRIFKYRREQGKKLQILDDTLLENVSRELQTRNDSNDRQYALEGCLKKLNTLQRTLLRLHYEEGQTYKQIAEQYNYAQRRMYTVMSRIHIALHECIVQTLCLWRGQE